MRFLCLILLCTHIFTDLSAQEDISQLMKAERYREVIEWCKDNPDTLCLEPIARAYYITGDMASAKSAYHNLLDINPEHLEAHKRLGTIYDGQKYWAKAIKHFTAVNNLDTMDAIYFRKNGSVHRSVGDITQALYLYDRALKINARDITALESVAELYLAQDSTYIADSLLNYGVALDSTHIGLQLLQAKVKYRLKDYAAVIDIMEAVESRYDFRYTEQKLLGFSYYNVDSLDNAIARLETAVTADPNPERAYYYLSQCYYKKEDYEAAQRFIDKTLEYARSPHYNTYLMTGGITAENRNDMRGALDYYQAIYNDGDYRPDVIYKIATISDLYYKDKSIAIRWYSKYIKQEGAHLERKEYAAQRKAYLQKQIHMQGGG